MKLRLQYRRYRVPFQRPIRTAHGPWSHREGVLIRLEDEYQRVGYGEVAPIPGFPGPALDIVEDWLRYLGEWTEREALEQADRSGPERFAIKSALADLTPPGHALAATSVQLSALLPAGREALRVASEKADLGFRVFKWKVAVGEPADEWAMLDDLLGRLPTSARLRLDANGGWDRRVASRWLDRLADRPIEFVEQPVAHGAKGAEDLLLGLAGDYPTPLALDESVVTEEEVARWINLGWPGVFVIKPAQLADPGGVADGIRAAGAKVVFSSSLETGIGARDALYWAFEKSDVALAPGFGVWPLFADSRFDGPHQAPFLTREDVSFINKSAVWNALP